LLLRRSFLRNNLLFMIINVLGFQNNALFCLMLLDVLNNSSLLAACIQCVTIPAPALGMMGYLVACTSVVYAQFGLVSFEGDNWGECHSAMSCFWLIMYKNVPDRTMFGVAETTNRGVDGSPKFMLRILFDTIWFIWNFLLFRIMTGLIFSTFGNLRSAEEARHMVLDNTGFVSGLERVKYGDAGLSAGSPSFDELVAGAQNHWTYVALVLHLRTYKSEAAYTGLEQHVAHCLATNNYAWLPFKNSRDLQQQGKAYDGVVSVATGPSGDTVVARAKPATPVEAACSAFASAAAELQAEVRGLSKKMARLEDASEHAAKKAHAAALAAERSVSAQLLLAGGWVAAGAGAAFSAVGGALSGVDASVVGLFGGSGGGGSGGGAGDGDEGVALSVAESGASQRGLFGRKRNSSRSRI
jgi:hypothetical protein